MVSCDVERLGEPPYHQLRVSIVYEPREQGKATEGVEYKYAGRMREGMIVLVAIVTVVAGRGEVFLVLQARAMEDCRGSYLS